MSRSVLLGPGESLVRDPGTTSQTLPPGGRGPPDARVSDQALDLGPGVGALEDEDGFPFRDVDLVLLERRGSEIERRPIGDEQLRALACAFAQGCDDDETADVAGLAATSVPSRSSISGCTADAVGIGSSADLACG